MFKTLTTLAILGTAGLAATSASAQMAPMGEELYNQTVQVRFADGTVNNVTFQPNGAMTIRAAGVNPVNVNTAVDLIRDEVRRLVSEPFSE